MSDALQICNSALNRLAKWRTFLVGWQVGTKAKGDPEADAISDHREATLLLRAEATTLARLLIEKKVFTLEEFHITLAEEANLLNELFSKSFPGVKATDIGLEFDNHAAETMRKWRK